MENNKRKKGIIIGVIVALVLVTTLGVTFALYRYSNIGLNQQLVTGDIYMKYTGENQLDIPNAMPREEYIPDKYFQFTIEGINDYSKDIWYKIKIGLKE